MCGVSSGCVVAGILAGSCKAAPLSQDAIYEWLSPIAETGVPLPSLLPLDPLPSESEAPPSDEESSPAPLSISFPYGGGVIPHLYADLVIDDSSFSTTRPYNFDNYLTTSQTTTTLGSLVTTTVGSETGLRISVDGDSQVLFFVNNYQDVDVSVSLSNKEAFKVELNGSGGLRCRLRYVANSTDSAVFERLLSYYPSSFEMVGVFSDTADGAYSRYVPATETLNYEFQSDGYLYDFTFPSGQKFTFNPENSCYFRGFYLVAHFSEYQNIWDVSTDRVYLYLDSNWQFPIGDFVIVDAPTVNDNILTKLTEFVDSFLGIVTNFTSTIVHLFIPSNEQWQEFLNSLQSQGLTANVSGIYESLSNFLRTLFGDISDAEISYYAWDDLKFTFLDGNEYVIIPAFDTAAYFEDLSSFLNIMRPILLACISFLYVRGLIRASVRMIKYSSAVLFFGDTPAGAASPITKLTELWGDLWSSSSGFE